MLRSVLALLLLDVTLAATAVGCGHRRAPVMVVDPGSDGGDGEVYLVDSPELARDVLRAQRLEEREARRAEKIARREARRAEKIAAREARRAEKLQLRWQRDQLRAEARRPDGFIVAAPPLGGPLPLFPYGAAVVELCQVAQVEEVEEVAPAQDERAAAPDALAARIERALNQQRAWRDLGTLAPDAELDALAQRYADVLAAAEGTEPGPHAQTAIADAEAALGGAAHAVFALDGELDYESHAVIAWLLDDPAHRQTLLSPVAAGLGLGVAVAGDVRVVVVVVEIGAEG